MIWKIHADLVRHRYRPIDGLSLLVDPTHAMYEKGMLRIWFRQGGNGPAVSIAHVPTFDRWANSRLFVVSFYPVNIIEVLTEARNEIHRRIKEHGLTSLWTVVPAMSLDYIAKEKT